MNNICSSFAVSTASVLFLAWVLIKLNPRFVCRKIIRCKYCKDCDTPDTRDPCDPYNPDGPGTQAVGGTFTVSKPEERN